MFIIFIFSIQRCYQGCVYNMQGKYGHCYNLNGTNDRERGGGKRREEKGEGERESKSLVAALKKACFHGCCIEQSTLWVEITVSWCCCMNKLDLNDRYEVHSTTAGVKVRNRNQPRKSWIVVNIMLHHECFHLMYGYVSLPYYTFLKSINTVYI